MCGFSGAVNFSCEAAAVDVVARMNARMHARGPDAGGVVSHDNVALGHRRLKIIDLSDRSRQPLTDPMLGLTVVFNGCIYNYRELRGELEAAGFVFFSDGDTEVIAKAWKAWGRECVRRFQGMFAFAVHDHASGRISLARDRLGIKPLYLVDDGAGNRVYFASSLPALLEVGDVDTRVDPVALNHYLSFHAVVPAPRTIIRGVRKVPPATVVEFDEKGRRSDWRYWDFAFADGVAECGASEADLEQLIERGLERAVSRRMVADVPVGVLLSGGLDSSLIVGLLAQAGQQDLHTFSIGFEDVGGESGNEFEYSDIVAEHFGTRHHRIEVDSSGVLERLPEAIDAMAEPMVSHDNVAFFLLAQEVSKHVKVVQSGQGADEVFAGYHWYPPLVGRDDPLDAYAEVFFDRDHEEMERMLAPALRGEDYAREFVAEHFARPGAVHSLDKALRLDIQVMLAEDPVKRVDNMTMAAGLEARVPFLDHELVELAAGLPASMKLEQGGKGVLKRIARQILPAAVIDRPKGYFPVPALKYIRGEYLELMHDVLSPGRVRDRGLFSPHYVSELLEAPEEHITPLRGSKLWQLGLLEMWLERHGVGGL
ncbi:MAG: N-acetylglutaminylglutamine amidotransferase [Gammaproteobacteria bacterium]